MRFSYSLSLLLACIIANAGEYAKPITGSWLNLAYQDVRNKYTNPTSIDYTDPTLWEAKVNELNDMGVEYLVFMAVANEGKSYYPSKLMPSAYPEGRKSPVDAIMDAAAKNGQKVFLSIGWAKDQDDNLRKPEIKQRQLDIMKELAERYANHPALFGWYLPVEDCLCPVLSEHAVKAVNELTARARTLTPNKKILISPYGIFQSDFANPLFEKRLSELKVDIIAYQDEVGCVREAFPLPRLRENWKKLRNIHDRIGIELWANCETFTWEGGTNDRSSALIPAAFPRLLAQQVAATEGGVERIISFMMYGIIENPNTDFQLGQPAGSHETYSDYIAWKSGDAKWAKMEQALCGKTLSNLAKKVTSRKNNLSALADGAFAEENAADNRWESFPKGDNEIIIELRDECTPKSIFARCLHYRPKNILPPTMISISSSIDGKEFKLNKIKTISTPSNDKHDAWADIVFIPLKSENARYLKITFASDAPVYLDEIVIE